MNRSTEINLEKGKTTLVDVKKLKTICLPILLTLQSVNGISKDDRSVYA